MMRTSANKKIPAVKGKIVKKEKRKRIKKRMED
jgi:hypothetical protein